MAESTFLEHRVSRKTLTVSPDSEPPKAVLLDNL